MRCVAREVDDRAVGPVRRACSPRSAMPSNASVHRARAGTSGPGRASARACRRARSRRSGGRRLRSRKSIRRDRVVAVALRREDRGRRSCRRSGSARASRRSVSANAPAVAAEQRHEERGRERAGPSRGDSTPASAGLPGDRRRGARAARRMPQTSSTSAPSASADGDHVGRLRDAADLDPGEDQHAAERDPQPALGHLDRRCCEPISTPGIEPTSSHAIACVFDVAVEQVRDARRPRAASRRGTCRCRRSCRRSAG